METWVDIKGCEGYYQVSDLGRVRSVTRTVKTVAKDNHVREYKSRLLKPKVRPDGYLTVNLTMSEINITRRVHRLVLENFCPPTCDDKRDCNHINGVRSDNRLINLEWLTRSENITHSYRILGRVHAASGKFGGDSAKAIPVACFDKVTGALIKQYRSLSDATVDGYCISKISSCINGKRAYHGNLTWKRTEKMNANN